MAKIILLWNPDPNESAVTLPLGRLLKKDLEKRGNHVQLVKMPFEHSIYAEFARNERAKFTSDWNEMLKQKVKNEHNWINRFQEQNENATIIELHTTPDRIMLKPAEGQHGDRLTKIRNWRAIHQNNLMFIEGQLVFSAQVSLHRIGGRKEYAIEIPASYVPSKGIIAKQFQAVPNHLENQRVGRYFTDQTDARTTKKQNYLAPRVVRKLGHLVDETLKREQGITRQPRRTPHRSRLPYPKPRRPPKISQRRPR